MTSQYSVSAYLEDSSEVGIWRVYARRPGMVPIEVTYFRGVPTQYGSWTLEDPFGAKSASLSFPKITCWDAIGEGDLYWLSKETDFDIVFDGVLPLGYPTGEFAWEGLATSFDYDSESGLTVGLIGAGYQLDNYLAKPEYLARPMPYEWAIQHQWQDKPDLRLKALRVIFPTWWETTFDAPPKNTRSYLIPTHVKPGEKWTGLTTRETGSWDAALTSYIQTLLASMYTERGRFALDFDRHRQPVLRHRDILSQPDSGTLVIDPAAPGVKMTLNVDWSQSLNVAYGQGVSLTGEGYSGMVVTNDGTRTTYQPLAAQRSVDPITDSNGWLDPSRIRKEVLVQLQQGLTFAQAKKVGLDHLQRFIDPGVTGSIVLTSDPKIGSEYCPRAVIKAGMPVQVPMLFGRPEGLLLHITSVTTDLENGSTTLSVDSKFRDALTVDEVKLRGRDALAVSRGIIGGTYTPPIEDMLLPWNYSEGSGFIPSGPGYSSVNLFEGMPDNIYFPWTEWTTQRPPSDESWTNSYIKIPRKSAITADDNWSQVSRRVAGSVGKFGFAIKMAQSGSIRLLQLAAYDPDGNLLNVPFHFSIYTNRGVNVRAMPRITSSDLTTSDGWKAKQHYPFFAGAWERYRADGTEISTENPLSTSSAGLVRGWGNRAVPAGYWPGSKPAGDDPTGMLHDETVWQFDTTKNVGVVFNPHTPAQNDRDAGYYYGMIYCESPDTDVYFVGRMYRVEPGGTVGGA